MRPMTPDEEKAFQAAFRRMIRRKTVIVKARPFLPALTDAKSEKILSDTEEFIGKIGTPIIYATMQKESFNDFK